MAEPQSKVPRKRKRTAKDEENQESKKQRGRPRLDPKDESAADRRRTQIRLAQRAYRMRKETTISALKQRNSVLQGLLEEMKWSLLKLNDQAVHADIPRLKPGFAETLNSTVQRFAGLAHEAIASLKDQVDDAETPVGLEEQPCESELSSNQSRPQTETQPHIQWTPAALDHRSTDYPAPMDTSVSAPAPMIGMGYQLTYEVGVPAGGLEGAASSLPFGQISQAHKRSQDIPRPGSVMPQYPLNTTHSNHDQSTSLTNIKRLQSPYTYSFQENTFARRLQRAAIEKGHQLALQTTFRPAAFKHVFRLALLFETREQLIERFQGLLARTAQESLDNWATPYLHIGGAGTHYPPRDANGNIIPQPNSYTVRSIGPPRIARLEDGTGTGTTPEMLIDISGYEGEWFDPTDVEGYLRERGIEIPPQSSFAEVEVVDGSVSPYTLLTRGSTRSEGSPPLTPTSNSTFDFHPRTAIPMEINGRCSTSIPSTMPMLSYQGQNTAVFQPSANITSIPTGPFTQSIGKRRVTIDVQQFISSMPNPFLVHVQPYTNDDH